jgi:hypothetical protein
MLSLLFPFALRIKGRHIYIRLVILLNFESRHGMASFSFLSHMYLSTFLLYLGLVPKLENSFSS